MKSKSRIDKIEYKFEKYTSGNKYWYKNGLYHRDNNKPAMVYNNGSMFWYKNGKLHRENDLPAIIYSDGTMAWYINGKFIKESRK